MYQEILDNLAYGILFNDYQEFSSKFWFGCAFLWEFFFAYWGVKIGAKFYKEIIFNLW